MTETDFLAGLADALELDCEICMDDEFRDYEDWDSLMFLSLVTYVRENCALELTPEIFETVDTWRDIYNKLPH